MALLHLAIAVPLYAWVKRRSRLTAPVAVLAGGAIGAVPMAIVTLPVLIRYPTEFLLSLPLYGAIGATAGMVFWIVLELQRKRTRQSPVASLVAAGAAVSIGITLVWSSDGGVTESCHDYFLLGEDHAQPVVNAELGIPVAEWRKLSAAIENFADKHALSYVDNSVFAEATTNVLELSLCTDRGLRVSVAKHQYTSMQAASRSQRGVSLTVFTSLDDSDWKPIARSLIATIEKSWPGSVRYRDSGGKPIALSETRLGESGSNPEILE